LPRQEHTEREREDEAAEDHTRSRHEDLLQFG
jgi:hypothetical protein